MSHSKKLKVLVHSNHSRLVTGFGKNAKNILLALYNDPDIEVIEAGNGAKFGADLVTPWESYGTHPSNPSVLQAIQGDGPKERMAQYGFYTIDEIVEKCKPDVYLGVEDIWAFTEYQNKPWWNKINKVLWTTLDSMPILDQALQMEPLCDKMLVWASFAEKEMKRLGHKNVETLHGAIDYSHFRPLDNRKEIRKKFGIDDCFVIGFVFKNQLRKSVPNLLQGFKTFKQDNPDVKAKLLLHTDWGEAATGWDIPRYIREMNIDPQDVLSTYVCHSCDFYYVAPYQGEDKNCPSCNKEKTFKTKSSLKGIGEKELNELYNCMDVYCHPFTSGGQELPIQEAKAAGLITLVTEYSCGTDSCYKEHGGVPLKWNEYREPQTQFIKASTCPNDIADKLYKVYNMDDVDKWELSTKAIKYVKEKFSTQTIAKKLKEILFKLEKPVEKEQPKEEEKLLNLEDVLDDEGVENRIAVVLPESAGDLLILNSLMENLKSLYPDKNIYVFTKPQFYQMIEDNPSVHRLLPYQQQVENLLFLEGRGDHEGYFDIAFLPNIGTQRQLNYLHNGKDKTQFDLR
jgi:glycosyltransferase involved in cell wall biosynthesis|tara:strand:+ start:267 stop:1973 length:1707 start_codon:yes stop_codon:yes gene_type:complete